MATNSTTPSKINALNITSWDDARSLIHTAAPILATALAAYGTLTEHHAVLWGALVAAIAAPALATVNTADGFRKWFYPILGAANAIAIGYGIADTATLDTWLPVVTAILGGSGSAVAAANVNTTAAAERPKRAKALR